MHKAQAIHLIFLNHSGMLTFTYSNISRLLFRILPVFSFLKDYSVSIGLADLIAGISVGLVVIPQGIAYAVVAKLPPEVGLYSSIMGCFLYILFGTSPELSNAPAAIPALMTGIYGAGDLSVAIFQSFMGGALILAAGICRLGVYYTFYLFYPLLWALSSRVCDELHLYACYIRICLSCLRTDSWPTAA